MRISSDEREFQLQLFNGRTYQTIATGTHGVLERSPDWRLGTVARRLVLTIKERALKPSRICTPRGPQYSHTAETLRLRYAKWAKAKGLTSITAWSGKGEPRGGFGIPVRWVWPEHFFAVTEETVAEAA